MKNKIEMRGIILPSMYDCEYLEDYIQKGIIIPESRFRANLAKADKSQDLNLYINSQGGSVFAGGEMINALLSWKQETGKQINITVGALAASMAANTIVQVGTPETTSVHLNTKIMFHGAMGVAVCGEEAFRDYADLLAKINADVKMLIIQKYDISPDTVTEWFKEGREGWLSADDANRIGMATEIIGSQAVKVEVPDNMDSLLNERGVKLAAVVLDKYSQQIQQMEDNIMLKKIMALLVVCGLKADADEKTTEDFVSGLKSDNEVTAAIDAAKADVTSGFELQIATAKATAEAKEKELSEEVTGLKTEVTTAAATISDLTSKLEVEQAKNGTLTNGLKAPKQGEPKLGKAEFFAEVKSRQGKDGISQEAASLAIQREQPELHKSMLDETNGK